MQQKQYYSKETKKICSNQIFIEIGPYTALAVKSMTKTG